MPLPRPNASSELAPVRPGGFAADTVALLATLTVALLLAVALSTPPRATSFSADRPPPASGLFELELRPGGQPARWTERRATLNLPNPGGLVRLSLQLTGGREVTATLSGPLHAELPLGEGSRRYQLLVPPQRDEQLRLQLETPTFATADDPRRKGLLLQEIGLRGGGRAPASLLLAAVLGAAALYALGRTAAGPHMALGGALAVLGGLLAWQRLTLWPAQSFAPLAGTAVMVAAVIAACRPVALLAAERLHHATPMRWTARGAALAALGLMLYLGLGVYNHLVVHQRLDSDLILYLRAGTAILEGRNPYAIFDLSVIGEAFVYTPATLPAFAALSLIDYEAVQTLWRIGNLATYSFALLALLVALPEAQSRGTALALVIVGLGFGPALETLAINQINNFMLLGLALFIIGHKVPRLAWAGDAMLAAVILIKITPGAILLWPLARGDWRRLARVALAGALLSVPALLLYGLWPWLAHAAIIPELLRGVQRNIYNLAVAGVLTTLLPLGSPLEPFAAWIGRLVSLVLLGLWALICLRRREPATRMALAFGVTVLTIASSLVWYHHLTFLVIPLAWLAFAAGRRERLAALVALGLIQATRLVEFGLGLPGISAPLAYLLVAAMLGLWLLGRQTRHEESQALPANHAHHE